MNKKILFVIAFLIVVPIAFLLWDFDVFGPDKDCLRPIAEEICQEEVMDGSLEFIRTSLGVTSFRCNEGHQVTNDWFQFTKEELESCEK